MVAGCSTSAPGVGRVDPPAQCDFRVTSCWPLIDSGARTRGHQSRASRERTFGPANSRNASLPTHRQEASFDWARRLDTATAAALSARSRLPIQRRAQLTAFFTKLRSSCAPCSMRGRKARNRGPGAALSCTTREAISAKPARLTNSRGEADHWRAFSHANGVRSNKWKQRVSQIAQLSKSRHQRFICAGVTLSGSATNAVSMRASIRPWPRVRRRVRDFAQDVSPAGECRPPKRQAHFPKECRSAPCRRGCAWWHGASAT